MAIHYKNDLYTEEQMETFRTQVGDVITLDVPNEKEGTLRGEHTVLDINIGEEVKHPKSGVLLTPVTLTLEG
jgi:hypothetical protein